MVIEYAKNVLNIANATTQEIDYKNNSTHIIHLIDYHLLSHYHYNNN